MMIMQAPLLDNCYEPYGRVPCVVSVRCSECERELRCVMEFGHWHKCDWCDGN